MRGSRIFIGFSDRFAKSLSSAGSVRLDFTGDNRRGCSRNSNHSGHYYSTQRSVHNLGVRDVRCGPPPYALATDKTSCPYCVEGGNFKLMTRSCGLFSTQLEGNGFAQVTCSYSIVVNTSELYRV